MPLFFVILMIKREAVNGAHSGIMSDKLCDIWNPKLKGTFHGVLNEL